MISCYQNLKYQVEILASWLAISNASVIFYFLTQQPVRPNDRLDDAITVLRNHAEFNPPNYQNQPGGVVYNSNSFNNIPISVNETNTIDSMVN